MFEKISKKQNPTEILRLWKNFLMTNYPRAVCIIKNNVKKSASCLAFASQLDRVLFFLQAQVLFAS